MKRDAQVKCSNGNGVILRQGDYIKVVGKHWLPKDHPFLEWGYSEREQLACYTAHGFCLVYKNDIDMGD